MSMSKSSLTSKEGSQEPTISQSLLPQLTDRISKKDLVMCGLFIVLSFAIEFKFNIQSPWLSISSIILSMIFVIRTKKHDSVELVYPQGWTPILGHLIPTWQNMTKPDPYDLFLTWIMDSMKQNKMKNNTDLKALAFAIPLQQFVVLLDPIEIDNIVTKQFDSAVKGPVFKEGFEPMLGNGIFAR